MPPKNMMVVSEQEYAALLNLDRMVRQAMAIPGTAELLVGALHALDHVRDMEGLPKPGSGNPIVASNLAKALIDRVSKP